MKHKNIVIKSLALVTITTILLTSYINIKANKLDYSTGSNEMYYDMNTHEYYFYQLTSEIDKENYRKIYEALINLDTNLKLNNIQTFDKISKLFTFVLNDHPEIFWVDNMINTRIYISGNCTTNIKYNMTKEEIKEARYEIDMFEMELKIKEIKKSMETYEKEVAIYDYISKNIKYDEFHTWEDKDYSQGIYSVVKGKTVCRGYSLIFKYICNKYNIPCIVIVGTNKPDVESTSKNNNHSWNEVMIDGEWYTVDITDSRKSVYKNQYFDTTFYKFNITTENLLNIASINKGAIVPKCTSSKYDYYKQTNTYFEKVDLEKFKQLMNKRDKLNNNNHYLSIRCANEEVFNKMLKLIETEDISVWREELNRDIYIKDTYKDSDLYIIKVEW